MIDLYQDGKTKRERYVDELQHLARSPYSDIAKVPLLADALEKQHGSILYPFFTEALNKIKQEVNEKGFEITPEDLNNIAQSNGIDLSATEIYLETISNDGYGLCIRVKNDRSGDEQMVYYDFLSKKLDTITPKNNLGIYYRSVFSPSGKTLVCYTNNDQDEDNDQDEHGFIYNVETRRKLETPEKFPYNSTIIMANDNDYYYQNGTILFKGRLNSKTEPAIIRDFEPLPISEIHRIDSENIGVAQRYVSHIYIIYNLKQDSIIYRTKKHDSSIYYDDFRGINSEYLVSKHGVFDLKQDSLIVDSYDDMYMWNNQPIEIKHEDDEFILHDMNGKVIKTITKDNSDINSSGFKFRNNYLYTDKVFGSYIFIYSLGAKLNRQVKITDADKKVFDLK